MKKLIVSLMVLALVGSASAVALQSVYAEYSFDAGAPLADSTGNYPDLVLGGAATAGIAAGVSGEAFESPGWHGSSGYAMTVYDAAFASGFSGGAGNIALDMWINLRELPQDVGLWGATIFGGTGADFDLYIAGGDAAGELKLAFWSSPLASILWSPSMPWDVDEWYNITWIFSEDTDTRDILVDGVSVASGAIPESEDIGGYFGTETNTGHINSHSQFPGDHGAWMLIDELRVGTIPEPTTICLLGLGGLLLRRKRKC